MGLAGVKNRRKLSKDPNNTKWTRNTDGFGHKILRSQGWEPGQYLGAKDASHAEFHTAASSSHIRVALKEDNLGIGATRNQSNECTGLDVFKDLLGRLNGKSEEVIEEERQKRAEFKMSLYVERKFGRMRFVSGGLLVGDKIQELLAAREEEEDNAESQPPQGESTSQPDTSDEVREKRKREKKSKKRKAGEDEGATVRPDEKKKKKRKKDKALGDEGHSSAAQGTSGSDVSEAERTSRRQDDGAVSTTTDAEEAPKKKSKKKDKKKRTNNAAEDSTGEAPEVVEEPKEKKERPREEVESTATSEAEAPSLSSRHMARRRFIAQKRRAVMDEQALKQIFMIKAKA